MHINVLLSQATVELLNPFQPLHYCPYIGTYSMNLNKFTIVCNYIYMFIYKYRVSLYYLREF